MYAFLQRERPSIGRVFFPGAIPPPLQQLASRDGSISWTQISPAADEVWAADVEHREWGTARIGCVRQPKPLPAELIDHTISLSDAEKARARLGHATLVVAVRGGQKQILRDRKRLLFWLRTLVKFEGAVAVDESSMLFWSEAMLDDECVHEAELDIESLYTIHAVQGTHDQKRVSWLHTHGLEELGAFDFDVLQPSPDFVANCGDPMRALAFAALEGTISPDADRFVLAYPGGDVRLVPVNRYDANAAPEHRNLRQPDAAHSGRRAVLCEPPRGLFGRWRSRPAPSRFLSELSTDGFVIPFSPSATALMAERARQTLSVFSKLRHEFEALGLPSLVKLGYEVEAGSPADREHLWFQVHQISGDKIDATLTNTPHRIPSLTAGQRGEFGLDRLTDWVILSPEGPMTPRNISAARRLRAKDAS